MRVVDKAFSRLKGRWQILLKRNEHKIAFIPDIVTTCCILHNICEQRNEPFNMDLVDGLDDGPTPSTPLIQQEDSSAENIRHALSLYLCKRFGHVCQSVGKTSDDTECHSDETMDIVKTI